MPRSPEFNRSDVLDKALDQFWSDGYEASSISKLLEVMELNRGSLYSAFRDKRSLFKEVMAHYVNRVSVWITRTLVETVDPLEALREFFYEAVLCEENGGTDGCLLFNTITELNNTMPELSDEAGDHMLQIRELFVKRLSEAKQKNMLRESNHDIDAQADFLLGVLAGFRVLCKMNYDAETLKNATDTALDGVFKPG